MTSAIPKDPHRRPRLKDHLAMFAVRYEDGGTAYIRVDPKAAEYGTQPVMAIARTRQVTGEIPAGVIVAVQKVR